jgi:hypothetical protein
MDNQKSLFKSKRFWTAIVALITELSLVFTGEKTVAEQLPLIVTMAFTLLQAIISVTSNTDLTVGGKVIGK